MKLHETLQTLKNQRAAEPFTRNRKPSLSYHKDAGLLGTAEHIGTVVCQINQASYINTSRSAGLYIGWDFMNCFNREYLNTTDQIELQGASDIHGVLQYITINNYFQIIESMPFESYYLAFLLRYKEDIINYYKGGNQYVTFMTFFIQQEQETRGGIIPETLQQLQHTNIVYTDISEHYEEGYVNIIQSPDFYDIKLTAHVTQGFGSKDKFEYYKHNYAKYHNWFSTAELTAKEYLEARLNMAFTLLYSIEAAFILPALDKIGDKFLLENYRPCNKQVYRLFSNRNDRDKYGTIYFKNRHEKDYLIVGHDKRIY